MNIQTYWSVTLKQDRVAMRSFFDAQAIIRWHNTNEQFTVDEFIEANCEYPGAWDGTIERIEIIDDVMITVTHVFAIDQSLSFHVTSFIKIKDDKIIAIDEYWGDDSTAPQWRLEKQIGTSIH